jgi:hypothetical protein
MQMSKVPIISGYRIVVSCKKNRFVNVCFVFLFIDDFFGFVSFLLCLVSFRFCCVSFRFVSVSFLVLQSPVLLGKLNFIMAENEP